MREIAYQLCDVFTSRALEGNQLAVFLDATGLSDAEMQALARETNLSETTFILPRDEATERENGVRVRIFTTQEELPFAGHPTLGTATVLRCLFPQYSGTGEIVLDLKAGRVPVAFPSEKNSGDAIEAAHAFGMMTQPQPSYGRWHDPAEVAPLLGLRVDDLLTAPAPQTVSTGLPFCIVRLRSLEALSRMRVRSSDAEEYFARMERGGSKGPHAKFFYAIAAEGANQWLARMQFYNGEDPATGSASGCAVSYLVQHGIVASGTQLYLRQGIDIHRPSDLFISAKLVNGRVEEVRVGGSTVLVAKGRFFLE